MKIFLIKTISTLALSSLVYTLPSVFPQTTPVYAAGYTELKHIPVILGLKTGTEIQTKGLASGSMKFTKVTPDHLQIHQDITLIPIGRQAIETVVGRKLTGKDNKVAFRFEVIKQKDGSFEYSLFDRGNNQLLVKGPVKVMVGTTNTTYQELEFKAILVKMSVKINKNAKGKVDGKASFAVGVIPVPGSLDFSSR